MKKVTILLVMLVTTGIAQDKSTVTVARGEVNNGVVKLTVHQAVPLQQGKASFVLQCNKSQTGCTSPPPGDYLMILLPENRGMYDCANVDLYPVSGGPQASQKIGEYCLIDK